MAIERNPILLPEAAPKKSGCPACGHEQYTGRNVQGVMTWKCPKCGNKWQGGLPRVPDDPLRPILPDTSPPPVQQVPIKDRSGNVIGVEELRRPVSLAQSFRKGAPIPEDGEI